MTFCELNAIDLVDHTFDYFIVEKCIVFTSSLITYIKCVNAKCSEGQTTAKEETQKVQSILGNNDVDIANNSIF